MRVRPLLPILFLWISSSSALVAPWFVGPLGDGGVGAIGWSSDGGNIAAVALPWELDGVPHHPLPYWHFQGGKQLPSLPLHIELLWSREQYDDQRIFAISRDPNQPLQERFLSRYDERALRLVHRITPHFRWATHLTWRETEGNWQSKTEGGWYLLPYQLSYAEWFYGGWLEWHPIFKNQLNDVLIRLEGVASRDHRSLYEGWEWQLHGGAAWKLSSAQRVRSLFEVALPHWEDREASIDSLNFIEIDRGRSLRTSLFLWLEFLYSPADLLSHSHGPAVQVQNVAAELLSFQLLWRFEKNLSPYTSLPLQLWFEGGAELIEKVQDTFILSLGITASLPGAAWSFKRRAPQLMRTSFGWYEPPALALPTRR